MKKVDTETERQIKDASAASKIEMPASSGNSELLAGLPLFATMDQAIDAAAQHLPEGWEIKLRVERDGYHATLEDPFCNEFDLDGGDGIKSDIWQAIMVANGMPC